MRPTLPGQLSRMRGTWGLLSLLLDNSGKAASKAWPVPSASGRLRGPATSIKSWDRPNRKGGAGDCQGYDLMNGRLPRGPLYSVVADRVKDSERPILFACVPGPSVSSYRALKEWQTSNSLRENGHLRRPQQGDVARRPGCPD